MKTKSLDEVLVALSSLARTGWMLRGVPSLLAETVSSHSFNSAIIAYELSSRLADRGVEVNPEKSAAIALFHDVGESVIGDIPKTAGISEAKREAEARAVASLPITDRAKSLILEFEERASPEAIIARVAELSATLIVGLYYKGLGYRVDEIIESSLKSISNILGSVEWGEKAAKVLSELLGVEIQLPEKVDG